jgi:hypothetical protein
VSNISVDETRTRLRELQQVGYAWITDLGDLIRDNKLVEAGNKKNEGFAIFDEIGEIQNMITCPTTAGNIANAVDNDRGEVVVGSISGFSVADNDTPCSTGATTFGLISEDTNIDSVAIDATTGFYIANVPAAGPAQFTYGIYCNGELIDTGIEMFTACGSTEYNLTPAQLFDGFMFPDGETVQLSSNFTSPTGGLNEPLLLEPYLELDETGIHLQSITANDGTPIPADITVQASCPMIEIQLFIESMNGFPRGVGASGPFNGVANPGDANNYEQLINLSPNPTAVNPGVTGTFTGGIVQSAQGNNEVDITWSNTNSLSFEYLSTQVWAGQAPMPNEQPNENHNDNLFITGARIIKTSCEMPDCLSDTTTVTTVTSTTATVEFTFPEAQPGRVCYWPKGLPLETDYTREELSSLDFHRQTISGLAADSEYCFNTQTLIDDGNGGLEWVNVSCEASFTTDEMEIVIGNKTQADTRAAFWAGQGYSEEWGAQPQSSQIGMNLLDYWLTPEWTNGYRTSRRDGRGDIGEIALAPDGSPAVKVTFPAMVPAQEYYINARGNQLGTTPEPGKKTVFSMEMWRPSVDGFLFPQYTGFGPMWGAAPETDLISGGSLRRDPNEAWTVRVPFYGNWNYAMYTYLPDQPNLSGVSYGSSASNTPNQWELVELEVIPNVPASAFNATLRLYINSNLVGQVTGIRIREFDNVWARGMGHMFIRRIWDGNPATIYHRCERIYTADI